MEDHEEDEEGEDLPDSLGAFVKEDIQDPDDPDPIAEFQRTVSFWERTMIFVVVVHCAMYMIYGSGAVIK